MRYAKAEIRDDRIVETSVVNKSQSELTGDCLPLQFEGLEACAACQYRRKPRLCGGGATLAAMLKNVSS